MTRTIAGGGVVRGWAEWARAIALVVAWMVATAPGVTLASPSNDEAMFLKVGRAIATTGLPMQSGGPDPIFFLIHTPLYVYGVAVISFLPLDLLTAMRGISWLTGLATLFMVSATVRGWLALVAGLLLGTSFLFVGLAWWAYMEIPMACAMTASVVLLRAGKTGTAGVAAAVAVLLKEFALLFVAVFAVYVLARHGLRLAWRFAAPPVVAFLGWLFYAWTLSPSQLERVFARWIGAATTETEGRFSGPALDWLALMAAQIGPLVLGIAVLGLGFAAYRRRADPLALACAGLRYRSAGGVDHPHDEDTALVDGDHPSGGHHRGGPAIGPQVTPTWRVPHHSALAWNHVSGR